MYDHAIGIFDIVIEKMEVGESMISWMFFDVGIYFISTNLHFSEWPKG